MPAELEVLFGPGVLDHTLVLLTCGDYLIGRTVEVLDINTLHVTLFPVCNWNMISGWVFNANNTKLTSKTAAVKLYFFSVPKQDQVGNVIVRGCG